jgi:hypothetical protein
MTPRPLAGPAALLLGRPKTPLVIPDLQVTITGEEQGFELFYKDFGERTL